MNQIELLEAITRYLLTVNTAAPVIFGLVSTIALAFRGITGTAPSLAELADLIERNLDTNDARIRAEIARLRALIG